MRVDDPTVWLVHASRWLGRRVEQQLRPLEIGVAYLPVATTLLEEGPMSQRELATRVQVEQATMTALLARLERDGWVVRAPHPTDRRSNLISLTDHARELLPRARAATTAVAERALDQFSEEERAMLGDLLRRVVDNLEVGPPWSSPGPTERA